MNKPGHGPTTLALLFAAGLAAYTAYWGLRHMLAPHPMEYRENAMLFSSALLLKGSNPYALENHPVFLNVYGMGYFWVTWPFTKAFGNSYQVLRLVSFAFVFVCCASLFWALRVDGVTSRWALIGALVWFAQLGQGLSIVIRPDSLGAFLLLVSLGVPYAFKFRPASLAVCAAASILAFLTKPYFILGFPIVCLYVIFFEEKLRGIVFGIGTTLAFFVVLVIMNASYECYFSDTFFVSRNMASSRWRHLVKVGGTFILQNLGFILIALAASACWRLWLVPANGPPHSRPAVRLLNLREPLFIRKLYFPAFILLCHSAVIVLMLGRHTGNDFLYYHQLISPFLLWMVFMLIHHQKVNLAKAHWLVLLNLALMAWQAPALPKDHTAEWNRLEHLVQTHTNIFTSPHLSHFLWNRGSQVYDTGLTEYHHAALPGNFFAVAKEYAARSDAFIRDIRKKINGQDFDLILVNRGFTPLLQGTEFERNYQLQKDWPAPMAFDEWAEGFPLESWVPRRKTPPP